MLYMGVWQIVIRCCSQREWDAVCRGYRSVPYPSVC